MRLDEELCRLPGRLMRRVLELDFAARRGIRIGDVMADEFSALKVLEAERNEWEREQAEKQK